MERGVLIGLAGLRWAAWVGLAAVAILNLHHDRHPVIVILAVVATGAVTLTDQLILLGSRWSDALRPGLVVIEMSVASAVVLADGWVHQSNATGQTLAGIWPLPAILLVAVAGGLLWAVTAGAVLSAARLVAVLVGAGSAGATGRNLLATFTTGASWIVFGAVCATIIRLLRRAQHQLAEAEARDHIARDLHDGVLQTLALIERRSQSPDIAQLARDQERDLRLYLFGDRAGGGSLRAQLERAATRIEQTWPGTAVTVTVTADLPTLGPKEADAVVGAATEALTNAAKHGHAARMVVFADIDEGSGGVFVSVKDDGVGFDPATVTEGVGMAESIRGRIEGLGGSVEFASKSSHGTIGSDGSGSADGADGPDGAEVRIRLPLAAKGRASRG